MKPYFVYPAAAASVFLALASSFVAITGDSGQLAWWAAALANLPLPLFIARLAFAPVVRTSDNLPLLLLVAAAGLLTALWESFVRQSAGWQPAAVAASGAVLLLLYVFWYSKFGRVPSATLTVGNKLPGFELADLEGRPVHSADFAGTPAILIFYRGRWCPFCVGQVREILQRYQDLQNLGIALKLISPQPPEKSRALAEETGVPQVFFVDLHNRAAEQLGIAGPGGISGGGSVQVVSGVLPTVIVTSAAGTILYSDQTDNYRVRPEPDIYISILKRTGALAT